MTLSARTRKPSHVRIGQHTSANDRNRQHQSAYVNIRQHASVYLGMLDALCKDEEALYSGAIKALLRRYSGAIKAILRLYEVSMKAL